MNQADDIRQAGIRGGQHLAAQLADDLATLRQASEDTNALYDTLYERDRPVFTAVSPDGIAEVSCDRNGWVTAVRLAWPGGRPPPAGQIAGAVLTAARTAEASAGSATDIGRGAAGTATVGAVSASYDDWGAVVAVHITPRGSGIDADAVAADAAAALAQAHAKALGGDARGGR